MIKLVNKDSKKFESKWDGEPFEIPKGGHKEVEQGLAEHFINKYPNFKLEIEEIKEEPPKPRKTAKKEKQEQAFEELG